MRQMYLCGVLQVGNRSHVASNSILCKVIRAPNIHCVGLDNMREFERHYGGEGERLCH